MSTDYPRSLQESFERAIVAGEYGAGDLVGVADLVHRFSCSPHDAELVLRTAHRKGLVSVPDSSHGARRVLGLVKLNLESLFTHADKSGMKPRSLVREVVLQAADAGIAQKLDVAEGALVYRYVRTRFVNEEAIANQTNYIPWTVCPGLEDDDVTRYSFQKLLDARYLTVTTEVEEQFRMVPAEVKDREVLGPFDGDSVLLVERIARTQTGVPVVWAMIRIRPDRYRYVAALWPQAAECLLKKI